MYIYICTYVSKIKSKLFSEVIKTIIKVMLYVHGEKMWKDSCTELVTLKTNFMVRNINSTSAKDFILLVSLSYLLGEQV
jgi:hypothetical protein